MTSAPRSSEPELLQSERIRGALLFALLVCCALGTLFLRLDCWDHQLLTRRVRDEATIPSANSLRVLSLGHRSWAADLLWTTALIYFGESISNRSQQRFTQRYAETIEDVDPNFRQAYLWAATISIYNGRRITRRNIENAIHHLRRGVERFPDDGELLHQLGFDYYFELVHHARTPEERQAFRRQGAEFLRRAAGLGHGPPWMALAATSALESAGLRETAVRELRELYLRTEDPAMRARVASRLEELLGAEAGRDPVLLEVRRLESERAATLPYVPLVLYLFVGPGAPDVLGRHGSDRPAMQADSTASPPR